MSVSNSQHRSVVSWERKRDPAIRVAVISAFEQKSSVVLSSKGVTGAEPIKGSVPAQISSQTMPAALDAKSELRALYIYLFG
jgi:hypothetical protein